MAWSEADVTVVGGGIHEFSHVQPVGGSSVTGNVINGGSLTLLPTAGYANNVLTGSTVSGGVQMGANVCNGSLCP